MEVFTRDIKAPRFRPTELSIIKYNRLLKAFKEKYPQYKDLSSKDFVKVIKTYNESLWQETLKNRDGVELPEGLGYIFVATCPGSKKKPFIDIGTSIKLGVKVHHRSFGSDGFIAKICYVNYANKYLFKHRELWRFVGARKFKRTLAKSYSEKWKMYIQLDHTARLNKLYKKSVQRDYFKKMTPPISRDYNEFDMN